MIGIEEKYNDGIQTAIRQVFELGSRACPTHGPLFRAWGFMEFQEGRTAEARRVFEKGLEVDPTHSGLYYGYADLEAIEVSSRKRFEKRTNNDSYEINK